MTETIRGYRLSAQQSRLWSLLQRGTAFRTQCAFLLEGPLDPRRLERALERVVTRHEILRTTFKRPSGLKFPVQVPGGEGSGRLHAVTLEAASDEGIDQLLAAERAEPFDPEKTAPVRYALGRLDADRHLLVVTASPLVADLGSLHLLGSELARAYSAADGPVDWEDEPLQYAAFAAWQAEVLEDKDAELGRTFWRAQDIASLVAIKHPLARTAHGDGHFRPTLLDIPLQPDVATNLREMAERRGEPETLLSLAVWRALLRRLTASSDLAIARRVHGRLDEELEAAMGPFASVVPMRAASQDGDAFLSSIDEVAGALRQARDWEPYFRWDESSNGADPSSTFLPFAFEAQSWPATWKAGDVDISVLRQLECAERFQLKLVCARRAESLALQLHFDATLFDRDAAVHLAEQYRRALAGAVGHPSAPVGEIEILGAEERRRTLLVFNEGPAPRSDDSCVHELFEEQAARFPDRCALVYEDHTITYRDLDARADALAASLRGRGVGPDARVGLLLDRSLDVIVGILGVMKAGGAYVPLDPALPRLRLGALIAEAGARVVVTTREAAPLAADTSAEVLVLRDVPPVPARRQPRPASGVTPGHLAYVMFTSGTTGLPKGVLVEHRQLAAYVRAIADRLEVAPGEHFATVSTFSADLGNTTVYAALCTGGCLHVMSEERRTDPDAMADYFGRHAIDCLKIVPSHLAALLEAAGPERLLSCRRLVLGGEATRWDLVERIEALGSRCRVFNHYGPTETTVGAVTYRQEPGGRDELSSTLPLGRPLAGYQAYVLEPAGWPAPIGVPGELHIGGVGVARGYLGRPAETAERFVPDPFGAPGGRLYRTGDVVRHLPSGVVEFRGRADHQIKIRGYRVEQGEVEAVLRTHPSVRDALVVAALDAAGNPKLIGYFVPLDGKSLTTEQVRDFTRERLPDYMVPSAFLSLSAFPLNRNGKIDRQALPLPDESGSDIEAVAPRTSAESKLAEIWTELLRLEGVGVHANFFDLGGHSLSAMQLVSRIRKAFQVELPLLSVFEEPTIAGLAARIESIGASPEAAGPPPIEPADRSDTLPASFSQERLWLFDQLQPENPAYNIPVAMRARGPLDAAALAQAVSEVVRRHEVLRTTFRALDGAPFQIIAPAAPCPLPLVDLSGLATADKEKQVEALAEADAQRPFDLSRGPVWRTHLLVLSQNERAVLWNQHHICSDAWSSGLLASEMSRLYGGYAAGRPSPLLELEVQYADFSVWQRRWLQGTPGDTQVDYWRQKLSAAPSELTLPTDRPRPRAQSFRGGAEAVVLSPELSRALVAVGRERNATLYVTLLSALAALLHLHAGQEDIVIGSPTAGRSRAETERLVGFFLNTLALRVEVTGSLTFSQLLARTRTAVLEAFANQELPFERIVDALEVERDASRSVLYQVMFNLLKAPAEGLSFGGVELVPIRVPDSASKFDLTLYATEAADGIALRLVYNADLFDATTARAMLARLATMLQGIVADPDQPVASLPLRSAEERTPKHARPAVSQERLVDFSIDDVEQSIVARFHAQVRRFPDRVAVKTRKHEWSYQRLALEAAAVAARVRSRAGNSRGRVGVLLDTDAHLFAAILGTLEAGHAYVPLDPANPRDRLAHMLSDSRTSLLLTDRANAELARELAAGTVPVIDVQDGEPAPPGLGTATSASPDDIAYILYTSGSTGVPKGVVQNHRNVLHFMRVYTRNLGIDHRDRLSMLSSYGFDGAVMDMYAALLNGAALLPTSLIEEGVEGALRWTGAEEVSVYHSTPTVFRQLLGADETLELPRVRAVVLGGEEALASDLDLFQKRFRRGALFVNGLGPSESTVTLQQFMDHDTVCTGNALSVGLPVENTEIVLLDREGHETEVHGEICIESAHVALGYWDDEEKTRAAFRPTARGGRAYRTGDLARRLPDGTLEFVGRKDAQVKIRGFRIEPGEVEAVLARAAGVRDCAVLVRKDGGAARLSAYVQPVPGHDLSVSGLRSFLREKLPEYMIPSELVLRDELPLTPHGKLDRAALGRLEAEPESRPEFLAPRTDVELRTAALWMELLPLERVSMLDDFFAVGGQSLLAMRLVSRIRNAFAIELPLRVLFEAPTLGGMAAAIADALERGTPGRTSLPRVQPIDRAGELPLSFAQQRMWILDQLEPNSSTYNVPAAVELVGPLHPGALEQAIQSIVRRHEVLRAIFGKTAAGEPLQRIRAEVQRVPLADLSGIPGASREALVRRLVLQEAERPFDLTSGPLLRVGLLRLDAESHVALFTMHHIVSDAWSTGVIVRELSQLYRAFSAGGASPLPALPIQYVDYAAWQRSWLASGVLEQQLGYWKSQLEGAPDALSLPLDRGRAAEVTYNGAREQLSLSDDLTSRLAALSRQEGTTLFVTLLAAFQLLLHRESGQDDIVVGTPVAGRTLEETEPLIGFFINTLVLRTRIQSLETFRALLRRVHETVLSATAHQDIPFERLVDELHPTRGVGHTPLFQVAFVLQNAPRESLEMSRLSFRSRAIETRSAKFDWSMALAETADGMVGHLEYNTDLFDAGSIRRVLHHFHTLLEGVVADPDQRLSELPLLSEPERRELVVAWNDTATPHERTCVHELVESRAQETPDATAVVYGSSTITYRELDERANRLARHLTDLWVGPEALVAICLERSVEMVVALLGVLKAGAAYLPLDPGYPRERLAFMLEDAGVSVVVTTESAFGGLEDLAERVVYLDRDADLVAAHSCVRLAHAAEPESLAYVIYTSGSTGRPKGVAVRHSGLANLVGWHRSEYAVGPADRASMVAALSFDASVWELWPYLASGASVQVADDATRMSPYDLVGWLQEQRVTLCFLPTPLAEVAILTGDRVELDTLRALLTGGDRLQHHVSPDLPFELINHYGPTENTVVATSGRVAPGGSGSPPIGKPIDNTTAYVLDERQRLVPVGVTGELYVGGVQVARGYLRRPALTAERFLPDPFGETPGARLYRTGDLVRHRRDGDLDFAGRVDHQVKVRGFRIELGEIEAVLARHPELREAVVQTWPEPGGGLRLVAYAVPASDHWPAADELRLWLAQQLPDYMVPSVYIVLSELPLTPVGKVDRGALPEPPSEGSDHSDGFAAPATVAEISIARIWEEVLQTGRVGVHDKFFDLGGHSLNAVQVITRLEKELGFRVAFNDLLFQTLGQIAATCADQQEQG